MLLHRPSSPAHAPPFSVPCVSNLVRSSQLPDSPSRCPTVGTEPLPLLPPAQVGSGRAWRTLPGLPFSRPGSPFVASRSARRSSSSRVAETDKRCGQIHRQAAASPACPPDRRTGRQLVSDSPAARASRELRPGPRSRPIDGTAVTPAALSGPVEIRAPPRRPPSADRPVRHADRRATRVRSKTDACFDREQPLSVIPQVV